MLPAAVSCKRNQLLKFRLWNIIVENHYLNMSPLVIANKIALSLFTEVAIWFFFVAIKLDWHPKYFHSAVMFLSLFYSDIHLLLKTLVLRKYNTGISIEAKLNWRSFLNPIVSVWSENVSWRVAVYRKLTNKGWPSPQLMVRQMR